ncbi:hypothetical protein B7486_46955 [cyanobacterium TDX16]|nr:hypothetical protein B7486_46955 [cyanobacterium TDX16]
MGNKLKNPRNPILVNLSAILVKDFGNPIHTGVSAILTVISQQVYYLKYDSVPFAPAFLEEIT